MFAEKIDLTLALENVRMAKACHENKIRFYWAYPITSFYELRGLVYLGVSELLLGAPLYFDLAQVKKEGLPIRLVANLCFDGYIPRPNGVCGTYVRPEDVPVYEKYVETLEFDIDECTVDEATATLNASWKLVDAKSGEDDAVVKKVKEFSKEVISKFGKVQVTK